MLRSDHRALHRIRVLGSRAEDGFVGCRLKILMLIGRGWIVLEKGPEEACQPLFVLGLDFTADPGIVHDCFELASTLKNTSRPSGRTQLVDVRVRHRCDRVHVPIVKGGGVALTLAPHDPPREARLL
eukprot:scaffold273857_cov27-Tisochrysis_lutea.AAC.1